MQKVTDNLFHLTTDGYVLKWWLYITIQQNGIFMLFLNHRRIIFHLMEFKC